MSWKSTVDDDYPAFDLPVPDNGYRWWYVDAVSDDGRHGLTIIAFVGSVFSPYYAWARNRSLTNPNRHCAINVALYGESGKRWAMTERSERWVQRSPSRFVVGPSEVAHENGSLVIDIRERTFPLPGRIIGRVELALDHVSPISFELDRDGHHFWRPLAPMTRIRVALDTPRLQWKGHAYHDCNFGTEPLEDAFSGWDWSRLHASGGPLICYEPRYLDGSSRVLFLKSQDGAISPTDPPPVCSMPKSKWRIPRATRADQAKVTRSFEDTPFYSRSELRAKFGSEEGTAVHETLDLKRFCNPVVRLMLPFRMPRRS